MRVPGQIYKKVCIVCGKRFNSQRSDAKSCSSSCRTILSRENDNKKNEVVLETGGPVKIIENLVKQDNVVLLPVKPLDIETRYRYRLGSFGVAMNSKYKRYLFATEDAAREYAKEKLFHIEFGSDLIFEGTSLYIPDGWRSVK